MVTEIDIHFRFQAEEVKPVLSVCCPLWNAPSGCFSNCFEVVSADLDNVDMGVLNLFQQIPPNKYDSRQW